MPMIGTNVAPAGRFFGKIISMYFVDFRPPCKFLPASPTTNWLYAPRSIVSPHLHHIPGPARIKCLLDMQVGKEVFVGAYT